MSDDPVRRGLSEQLIFFRAIDRATGTVVVVDQRTFDPRRHDALDPIPEEATFYVRQRSPRAG